MDCWKWRMAATCLVASFFGSFSPGWLCAFREKGVLQIGLPHAGEKRTLQIGLEHATFSTDGGV
jgi:hypothetical protein